MSTWCRSAVNRAFPSRSAACRTRSSPCDTRMPALCPEPVVPAVFPLVRPLPSTLSAARALFEGLAGSTGLYDFPPSFISGLRPQPSLSGPPPRPWTMGEDGISRFSRMKVPCVQGSSTPQGPLAARAGAAGDVAFHSGERCRHPDHGLFRGSFACPHVPLANASAPPSRAGPHSSGPPWVATPSVSDSCIPDSKPVVRRFVYPGASLHKTQGDSGGRWCGSWAAPRRSRRRRARRGPRRGARRSWPRWCPGARGRRASRRRFGPSGPGSGCGRRPMREARACGLAVDVEDDQAALDAGPDPTLAWGADRHQSPTVWSREVASSSPCGTRRRIGCLPAPSHSGRPQAQPPVATGHHSGRTCQPRAA
jgi:hypothetical protein